MEKHADYWYIILPNTISIQPHWFSIIQEDQLSTVRYSLDGSKYLIKLKKDQIPQYVLDRHPFTVGGKKTYMSHTDMRQTINFWDKDDWNEDLTGLI